MYSSTDNEDEEQEVEVEVVEDLEEAAANDRDGGKAHNSYAANRDDLGELAGACHDFLCHMGVRWEYRGNFQGPSGVQ